MKINYLDAQITGFHFKCNKCKTNALLSEQFFNSDRVTFDVNFFNSAYFVSIYFSRNMHTTSLTVGSWNTGTATNKFKCYVPESVEV